MPSRTKRVRFETEYNSSFKAFDADTYKSPLISALIDEPRDLDKIKTVAGLKSNKFLKSAEPPLQSKSKSSLFQDKPSKTILNNGKRNVDTKNELKSVGIKHKPKKNRALEFKAGLKPGNSLEQTKFPVSEYQCEYEWKKSAVGDSPLLNAEMIVFDSHTNIPRFVRDKIPRKTEYQSKFARDEARRVTRKEKKDNEDDEARRVARKEKKDNEDEKEESDANPTSTVKRLLQTSQNPDPPFFPRGSNRVIHTEYQANFGSPKKYQYEEGIWLGAKPPHLLPDDQLTAGSSERITNWFEEVLELRAKARHYKIRATEGNYFSREYLAQLDAELEQLYVEPSEGSESKKKSGHGRNARRHAGGLGRPFVKHAWGGEGSSEGSDSDDGKKVYRDLNEQFRDVSLDSETISNHSEHGSLSSGPGNEKNTNKKCTKPTLRKTVVNQKPSPTFHETKNPQQTIKEEVPLLHNGPGNEHNTNKKRDKPSFSKTVKHIPTFSGTTKPRQTIKEDPGLLRNISSGSEASSELSEESKDRKYGSLDKFNIKHIQGMHSNDIEAPSTSVRSNYGSESERLSKNAYDSDSYLSQSSLASRESVALETLVHAKQRKDNFWH